MSHPARVCGLKRKSLCVRHYKKDVTPRAGVRIETQDLHLHCLEEFHVTPRAGVRIETKALRAILGAPEVTPRAGVRIETWNSTAILLLGVSHTPRGCAD